LGFWDATGNRLKAPACWTISSACSRAGANPLAPLGRVPFNFVDGMRLKPLFDGIFQAAM
jgi:hypothetical protein